MNFYKGKTFVKDAYTLTLKISLQEAGNGFPSPYSGFVSLLLAVSFSSADWCTGPNASA